MTLIARSVRLGAAFLMVFLAVYAWGGYGAPPVLADPAPIPEVLNTNAAIDSDSEHDYAARLAADSSGVWVAVWESDGILGGTIGADEDILFARSTDAIEWSAPAALNTNAAGDTGDDSQPDVATDDDGTWITVWSSDENVGGAGTDPDILFSRSIDGGLTWTAPGIVNSDATTDVDPDLSARIATDGAGNWVAVWHSAADGDSDIYMARSSNDGVTWTAPIAVNDFSATDSTHDISSDIVTNGAGTWIAVWLSQYNAGGPDIDYDVWTARSTNAGATWSAASHLNSYALTDTAEDFNANGVALANNGGNRWMAVWNSPHNLGGTIGTDMDILSASSFDDGVTWTTPTALNSDAATDSESDGNITSGPALATDGGGNWSAIWPRGSVVGPTDVLGARSTDDGATWDPPISVKRSGPGGLDRGLGATYSGGNWILTWDNNEDLDGIIKIDRDILRYNCLGDGRLDCLRDLPRLIVDDTGDGSDASPGDGTCATGGAVCTLRAAIQEANALGGARIYFRIAGAGPHVISPATTLPTLTSPSLVDGMTEPDYFGTPIVQVDGSSLANSVGLEITGNSTTVKGLSITNFAGTGSVGGSGIYATSNDDVITGNFLGISPDGVTAAGNRNGVAVNGSSGTRVGGHTLYERNIIAGNSQVGAFMLSVSGGAVVGNYVGTNAAGTAAVPNVTGVAIVAGSANIAIGNNLVSGNSSTGLSFGIMAGTGHAITGNLIGTAVDGVTPLGNAGSGISFTYGTDNLIGGVSPADANIIAHNGIDGVRVDGTGGSQRNTIRGNSIHSNTGLGIENVSGGNTELTRPLITVSLPSSTFGTACNNCTVDLYSDNAAEGRVYEGSTTADGSGNWALMATPSGPNLTATATDSAGNTSEFSPAVVLGDADSDGVADVSEGECGDSIDNDGNGFVNDGCPQVGGTAESGADCTNSVDDDGDGWVNDGCPSMGTEIAACGSQAVDDTSIPERVAGTFLGQDDDGDTLVDEALPAGAEAFDCDGDGYIGDAEDHVFSYVAQTDGDQKVCGEYDTGFVNSDPNQTSATPSLRWPSDFVTGSIPDSTLKVNIADLSSFVAPVRYLGSNVGTNPLDVRWDLSPGPGLLSVDINVLDLSLLVAGPTGNPPMFGGARAFSGPLCPWPE